MNDLELEQDQVQQTPAEEETLSMADFMDEIDKSMSRVSRGDLISGTIAGNNGEALIVNMGHMADGIVPKEEVDFDGGESIASFAIGDAITCYVLKSDDGEGNVLLSKKRADAELVWDQSSGLQQDQRPITVKIKEVIKGGLIAYYKGIRTFIPLSQVSVERVEDPETWIGKDLQVVITEINEEKKSMVASGRALQERQQAKRKDQRFHEISEGQQLVGTVSRLTEFGAFVDLGGLDGLIHLSELSWKRVKHASDVVEVGQTVKVTVLKVDSVNQKVSLRLADITDNPWDNIEAHYAEGDICTGKVTRLQNFGAFVELEDGVEGLVHISEISEERISKPQDKLSMGQVVNVMILNVDSSNHKISLSLKAAAEAEVASYTDYLEDDDVEAETSSTLGDLFADKFKNLKF